MILGLVHIRPSHQKALTKMADKTRVRLDNLVDQALEKFLTERGFTPEPDNPELSTALSTFALSYEVTREKLIEDLRNMPGDTFTRKYPLSIGAPGRIVRLRNYVQGGGR